MEYPRILFGSLKSGTLESVFDTVYEDNLSLRHHFIFCEFKDTSKLKQNVLFNYVYTVYRGYIRVKANKKTDDSFK